MKQMPGYVTAYTDEKLKEKRFKDRAHHLGTLKSQAHYLLTLCEQLRFVYDDIAQIEDPELRASATDKLVDALIMAKRMNGRLVDYKKTVGKYSGAHGAHLIHLTDTKARKRLRGEREASSSLS